MAGLDFALLAHSARQEPAGGLLSMLGAGINRLGAPEAPIEITLTFVGRVRWDEAELGQEHTWRLVVSHEDGERLVTLDGAAKPEREEHHLPWPITTAILFPVPLLFRRRGTYTVTLRVDDQPMALLPLLVELPLT